MAQAPKLPGSGYPPVPEGDQPAPETKEEVKEEVKAEPKEEKVPAKPQATEEYAEFLRNSSFPHP